MFLDLHVSLFSASFFTPLNRSKSIRKDKFTEISVLLFFHYFIYFLIFLAVPQIKSMKLTPKEEEKQAKRRLDIEAKFFFFVFPSI